MQAASAKLEVGNATLDEISALGRIWWELMQMHEQRDASFALAPDALSRWEQMAAEMIERHDTFLLAARIGGVPVGFCVGWVARNPPIYEVREMGFISEIAVTASARRTGVGSALLNAARRWFRDRGLHEFQLSTAIWNHDAQKFWQAHGGHPLLVRYCFSVRPS